MNPTKTKITRHMINKDDHDSILRVHELNKHTLITVQAQLMRAGSTRAWKAMCTLRKFNEQFVRGPKSEKKKFVKWFKTKLFGGAVLHELELSRFSPIQTPLEIHDLEFKNNESPSSTVSNNTDYIKYDVPVNYDVIRFPVIEWDFRWQRPQQISVQFADHGHRVFYLSIDTIGIEKRNAVYSDIAENIQIRELRPNVWWVKLCSNKPLNAYRNTMDELDIQYLEYSIEALKRRFSINYTVSILDLPFWAPLVIRLSKNVMIYDCMDDHSGFSTNAPEMLQQEQLAFNHSNLVVTTSQRLDDKIKAQNVNSLLIRNAGQFEHFSQKPERLAEEISRIKGPIIGYYGAISEWFDIDLIAQLAQRNKQWTFVLVGDTYGCDITTIAKLENVIFTGEKPYVELPSYLYGFDVCLIPFIINELTLATNPVKVYEYLASGKAVVATPMPELKMIDNYVKLASNVEEFEKAIQESLLPSDQLKQPIRQQFAMENSWKSRYEQLQDYLEMKFFPKVSIVIVTYNNWAFTKQCLNSLFENNDYPNVEIIIVDNASKDETRIELSRIIHPQVKTILSPTNKGFAGGNTIGCQAATGDYIILLNNDTIVPPGWINRLIRPLKNKPELGMVGPMSNSVGNDQMLDHFVGDGFTGQDPDWLNEFYEVYKGQIRQTEILGFYCVAMKREVYEKVGDLDSKYGIGMFEDDDYCERVKQAGYLLAIVEDAFVYHHGSVSFKKLEDAQYRSIFIQNKAYFERKWDKEWQMPNPPATLFYNSYDSNTIAERVKENGKASVIIFGDSKWHTKYTKPQQIALELSQQGLLVIYYCNTYHTSELVGTRKLGPSLYLSNRPDLFDQVNFDLALYCGSLPSFVSIRAKQSICVTSLIPASNVPGCQFYQDDVHAQQLLELLNIQGQTTYVTSGDN